VNSKRNSGLVQFVILIGIILITCGSVLAQDVSYNFAQGTDYSKFKTYKWVNIPGGEIPNQLLDQQIKQSIDSQLAAKGFIKTDAETADLFVGYQVSISQQQQWNAYGMGGMGWRMGGGMATATSTTIQIGTLGFDVYDQSGKQLIWRGSATKTLNPPKDPEKKQRNLDNAVAKLLKNFPPPVKK
jgi:Domain of unknown function (DUF4136)